MKSLIFFLFLILNYSCLLSQPDEISFHMQFKGIGTQNLTAITVNSGDYISSNFWDNRGTEPEVGYCNMSNPCRFGFKSGYYLRGNSSEILLTTFHTVFSVSVEEGYDQKISCSVNSPNVLKVPCDLNDGNYELGIKFTNLSAIPVGCMDGRVFPINATVSSPDIFEQYFKYRYEWNGGEPLIVENFTGQFLKICDVTVQNQLAGDVYLKDSPLDYGIEPNNNGQIFWNSEDIWMNSSPDGMIHQNPEYSTVQTNQPYIRVRLRNRGCTTISGGTLKIYSSDGTTLNRWDEDWTQIGEQNGIVVPPSLSPETDPIFTFQWTNMPQPQAGNNLHWCLLARFESPTGGDPLTGEVIGEGSWLNVLNKNNIAQKNVSIVDLNSDKFKGKMVIKNDSKKPSVNKFTFNLSLNDSVIEKNDLLDISLTVNKKFAKRIQSSLKLNKSIKQLNDSTFTFNKSNIVLDNIKLNGNEKQFITVTFIRKKNKRQYNIGDIHYDIKQYKKVEDKFVMVGGYSFVNRKSKVN